MANVAFGVFGNNALAVQRSPRDRPAQAPLRPADSTASIHHLRAGTLLLERGLVSAGDLGMALTAQAEWSSSVGEVLIGRGLIRPIDYYQALADVQRLPFVNLQTEPPDVELLWREDRASYSQLQLMPWKLHDDSHCVIAAVTIGEPHRQWAERRFGPDGYSFVVTSPFDIFWQVQSTFREQDSFDAREALFEWKRDHSAKFTLTKQQKAVMITWAAIYFAFLAAAPATCLVVTMAAMTILYTITFAFKFLLTWVGASRNVDTDVGDDEVSRLCDADLPVYTVLVPMYREAKVLPLLIEGLKKLDYPASKLEVKLVLEEDDSETIEAAKALKPPGTFEIIRVPASQPKTKPKACNYALAFARGEFITIYDAEDQPEPDQLKKAVAAFRRSDEKLACVQARLNYFNRGENWLTKMFTLEYSQWFDFLLPGLDQLNMPIPLGGTSNHFRLSALRQVRGWDPYNVTEDADLGIRLAQEGFTIGVINSTTYEEANGVLPSWIKQRSRWIKGYMQTWLVHMRHPIQLWRSIGPRGVFSFHFFIGAPALIMLANPVMWTITLFFYVFNVAGYDWLFPGPIGWMATFNLVFANLFLIYFGVIAALKRRYLDLVITGVMQPLYWVLHSIASYKALSQLIRNPHYWEKTEHGTSHVTQTRLDKALAEAK